MAIKKMDPTPYLNEGESVVLKAHAKQNALATIEVAMCYVVLFLTVIGDCFVIGSSISMKQLEIKKSGYVALLIALFVVHLVPFIFWVVYSIKKMRQKSDKWYALTNKRLLIVQDKKPIVVTFIELSEITAISNGKDSIVLFLDEERVKIDGLEDVVAFSDRLELLAFGEEKDFENAVIDANKAEDSAVKEIKVEAKAQEEAPKKEQPKMVEQPHKQAQNTHNKNKKKKNKNR